MHRRLRARSRIIAPRLLKARITNSALGSRGDIGGVKDVSPYQPVDILAHVVQNDSISLKKGQKIFLRKNHGFLHLKLLEFYRNPGHGAFINGLV